MDHVTTMAPRPDSPDKTQRAQDLFSELKEVNYRLRSLAVEMQNAVKHKTDTIAQLHDLGVDLSDGMKDEGLNG